jgi:hypothetical protein
MENLKSEKRLGYIVNGLIVFSGVPAYVTKDGWIGIRQADGQVEEAPATRCIVLRGEK